jgi:hypothetical protein
MSFSGDVIPPAVPVQAAEAQQRGRVARYPNRLSPTVVVEPVGEWLSGHAASLNKRGQERKAL